MSTPQREMPDADPFAGLPLLIRVPQAAKLIGISRARSCCSEEDDERHEWPGGKPTRTAGSASDRGPATAQQHDESTPTITRTLPFTAGTSAPCS